MSYIRTKLSDKDKDILDYIYEELEDITLPTTFSSQGVKGHYHAVKIGVTKQKNARQTCFGVVKYKGKFVLSKYLQKYPEMMDLFKEFIDSHYPEFEFNSVYVNKNVICKWHKDSKNVGESLLVGMGAYTGGQSVLKIINKELKFHIKSQSLIFNGSEIEHRSLPFEGTRYSLVFFKVL
jgi:hypothetical protein